jgi:uncharacterized membrane protein
VFEYVALLLVVSSAGAGVAVWGRRFNTGDSAEWTSRIRIWLLRWADVCFAGLLMLYALVMMFLTLQKHLTLSTGLDLAIFDQKVWNSLYGTPLESTIVRSMETYGEHFSPLLIALAPLYALVDDARVLLIVQTVLLTTTALPIYWYARRYLGRGLALVIAVSFFASPALHSINLSHFHEIALAMPLLSFAFYFLLHRRYVPLLVCLGLLFLVKEDMAAMIVAFGVYIFLFQRRRLLGTGIALFGAAALFFLVMYLVPALDQKDYVIARQAFGNFGGTIPEIVGGMITDPGKVINLMGQEYKIVFLLDLLTPLAFLPLMGFQITWIALPEIAGLIMSEGRAAIATHYPAPILPVLYFGLSVGIFRIVKMNRSMQNVSVKLALATSMVSATGLFYAWKSPLLLGGSFQPQVYIPKNRAVLIETIQELVPANAVVVAQEELLAHFSNRKKAYDFPTIPNYRQADYLVAKKDLFFYTFHKATWDSWMTTGFFETVVDQNEFILMRRKIPEKNLNLKIGNHLTLLGYSLAPPVLEQDDFVLQPILAWQLDQPISQRYTFLVQVVDGFGHVWCEYNEEPHNRATPTDTWQAGKIMTDQYHLKLPPTMPSGNYQLVTQVSTLEGIPLQAYNLQGKPLGTSISLPAIPIAKNHKPVAASDLPIGERLFADMGPLRLLGFELASREYNSGDMVQLGLYWRARIKPGEDYWVQVQLRNSRNEIVFSQKNRPAQGTFATTEWQIGEVLLDWHDWQIPSSLPRETYTLNVSLVDHASSLIVGQIDLVDVVINH